MKAILIAPRSYIKDGIVNLGDGPNAKIGDNLYYLFGSGRYGTIECINEENQLITLKRRGHLKIFPMHTIATILSTKPS